MPISRPRGLARTMPPAATTAIWAAQQLPKLGTLAHLPYAKARRMLSPASAARKRDSATWPLSGQPVDDRRQLGIAAADRVGAGAVAVDGAGRGEQDRLHPEALRPLDVIVVAVADMDH